MPKKIFAGVSGKAKEASALYVGVLGKARKVKQMYVGVDGKAKLCYPEDGEKQYEAVTGWKFNMGHYIYGIESYQGLAADYYRGYLSTENNEMKAVTVSAGEKYRLKIEPYTWHQSTSYTSVTMKNPCAIGYKIMCIESSDLETPDYDALSKMYIVKHDLDGRAFTDKERGVIVCETGGEQLVDQSTSPVTVTVPIKPDASDSSYAIVNSFDHIIQVPDNCRQLVIAVEGKIYNQGPNSFGDCDLDEELTAQLKNIVSIERVIF